MLGSFPLLPSLTVVLGVALGLGPGISSLAQVIPSPIQPEVPQFPKIEKLPSLPDLLPETPLKPQTQSPELQAPKEGDADTIIVEKFVVEGSRVFSATELAKVTDPFLNRPLRFEDLLEIRSALTQLYVDAGYITSGVLLPADQVVDDGRVKYQAIEGQLNEIQIKGANRLQESYIRQRIKLGAKAPLNLNQLLDSLRRIQLNPLISGVSAELVASELPGLNLLIVSISEANSGDVTLRLDNGRTENIGSLQRQVHAEEGNLTGRGDRLSVTYGNTDGLNEITASYEVPINARDGSLNFSARQIWSRVIAEPFDQLDLTGTALSYRLQYRQPVIQTPTQELALGILMGRKESQTELLGQPFPISLGADAQGKTKITGLDLFQEWTTRDQKQILSLRSNLGIGLPLGATDNPVEPDGEFWLWRGQAQWIRQFAPDQLMIFRSNVQLADRGLLPQEQFSLGGTENGRGYPQDFLLADNGITATLEGHLPILRLGNRQGLLQVTSFLDYGQGWNLENRPIAGSNHLLSAGLGLRWQWRDRITAQVNWGVPLLSNANRSMGIDNSQVYFAIESRLF